jgi:hypothetical protein
MHETELRIDEIEIQAQTFTPSTDQTGPLLSRDKIEALAGFHCSQNADEPFGDPIGIRYCSGLFLLPDFLAIEVDIRPPAVLSDGSGMLLNPFRLYAHELLELLEEQTLVRHETIHGLRPTDRQISLEKNPIKTGYRSGDFLCMLMDKVFRGVPPFVAVSQLPH